MAPPKDRALTLDALTNKALLAAVLLVVGRGTSDDADASEKLAKGLKALQTAVDTNTEDLGQVKRATASLRTMLGDELADMKARMSKVEVAQNRTHR